MFRGGKDRDTVVVDALERLVIDHVPLEQCAHGGWWVQSTMF